MPVHLKFTLHRPANAALDMTKGGPLKLIFVYSVPLLIGNIIQQLYNMVDTIIVGRLLGTDALAAVGNTTPMNFLVLGFVTGLTAGFAVITAQRFGAKDTDGLKRSVAMNFILNGFSSVIMTFISIVTVKPILYMINTPQSIFDGSRVYITVIYIGIAVTVLYNSTACILRAVGDSRSPLYFLIISSILNVFLDIIFISKLKMGVGGAAWATVISQTFAGIASLFYMFVKFPILRVNKRHFAMDFHFASRHLKIGLPMAFQFSITAVGVVVLQGALNIFGPVKIAGYTAAQKVESLIAVAAGTFGVTMANYTGQNLGAHRIDRIKEGTGKCCFLTVVVSILSALLAWVFADQFSALFVDESQVEVISASRQYLRITSLFYPALFVIFVFRNVLQSLGRGFMPLMAGVGELIARTAGAYLFPLFFGYAGICFAGPAAWVFAAVPLAVSYFIIIKKFK